MGRTGTVALALAAAGVVVAGCGSAGQMSRPSRPRAPVTVRVAVPRGGSAAEARAVGKRMLASLILPAGSHRIAPRSAPPRADRTLGQDIVDVSRFYWLPLPENAAIRFLLRHVPAGTSQTGSGSEAGFQVVDYSLNAPPAGLEEDNTLEATVTIGPHDGTLLRADAELQWYPSRSAAEYLLPAAYRAVTITVTQSVTLTNHKPRTITRVFTSPAVIARLARLLDSLHATTRWFGSCPAGLPEFQLVFVPRRHGHTRAITPDGCRGEDVGTGGLPQPALEDGDSTRLLAVIGPLLGVSRHFS